MAQGTAQLRGSRPMNVWFALALFFAVCFAAAGLGSLVSISALQGWYTGLIKPSFNPPNSVFGPVWTLLYVLMAVSGWLVWKQGRWAENRPALTFYGVQLFLNVLWSVLFFGLHQTGAASAEILVLWIAILGTTILFWRRNTLAGALLVPYLGWVTFAALLNITIWQLNR